ncbi:MAG: hypothetical protein B6D55_06400 [Candidatus Omnitrophica bacterium 4484_70.2]|nr:MAG: hypothetical protein B6D55_06400 [Candidatus Omnitrophica bacterium 4484_70.2]
MLWYIVDGWNIINKVLPLKTSLSPPQELISYIRRNRLTGSRNNKVTVVFDGKEWKDIYEREFEIIFTGEISADEVIKRKVEKYKYKKQIVVISDDRQIIEFIKREGATSQKIEEFVRKKKKNKKRNIFEKEIDEALQNQITEELKKIWLNE